MAPLPRKAKQGQGRWGAVHSQAQRKGAWECGVRLPSCRAGAGGTQGDCRPSPGSRELHAVPPAQARQQRPVCLCWLEDGAHGHPLALQMSLVLLLVTPDYRLALNLTPSPPEKGAQDTLDPNSSASRGFKLVLTPWLNQDGNFNDHSQPARGLCGTQRGHNFSGCPFNHCPSPKITTAGVRHLRLLPGSSWARQSVVLPGVVGSQD